MLTREGSTHQEERYMLIQDMSISATKTAEVMNSIKKLNSQINGYQNKLNEINRQMGYQEDEILISEKKTNYYLVLMLLAVLANF
tara:strand:+ start:406 stop:660 length:255 start_codon:yes stop_codon:yes gene_type:complete